MDFQLAQALQAGSRGCLQGLAEDVTSWHESTHDIRFCCFYSHDVFMMATKMSLIFRWC